MEQRYFQGNQHAEPWVRYYEIAVKVIAFSLDQAKPNQTMAPNATWVMMNPLDGKCHLSA